jgi:hypothetical protein
MSNKQPIIGDVCEELRQERRRQVTYRELDDTYTLDIEQIIKHVIGNCECDDQDIPAIDAREDEPWREKYVVKELYRERGNRFTEMAEILDCHSETAKKYVDKFDISPIDSSNRTSSPRVNRLQRLGKEKEDLDFNED